VQESTPATEGVVVLAGGGVAAALVAVDPVVVAGAVVVVADEPHAEQNATAVAATPAERMRRYAEVIGISWHGGSGP
jgi:hypothetical protein